MSLVSFSPNTLARSADVNANFEYLEDLINALVPSGVMLAYGGKTEPSSNWLFCYGQNVSRSTYAALFDAIVPAVGTFTVTIATPGVFTLSSHGMQTGDQVYLTTTGALPTGLSANTLYYVIRTDANTFRLATSRANAAAGTAIATSGSQSGVHTLRYCPHGLGDGSTTFGIPDARGRVLAGNDFLGGTAASRLTLARSQGVYGNQGSVGGAESHVIVTAELASHTHSLRIGNVSPGDGSGARYSNNDTGNGVVQINTTGSDTAHNNVQPTLVENVIIKV